ncbi:hypothetical protein A3C98_04845 [Candidatus Roizmanbacteria bacterium RIFCSPHIGHO2_02_FULL_37_15]|uniref:DUF305 domain-containing protein n=1 Tax=Candidatus Roizmanbacteria bacterium RIFCSPLOWO2_01_FULL_37_16 TaxID=1802058 RepID=A0A1F7IQN9_9BACT|nr:MAG: hypothetical protein A2859_03410 [Candidatus Roizmanbacteria bacterium RIFCSPHIGHO2_01_FULL_37_16b]OGK22399.1 MAG: hypothetical protein A3C98_04845 [Candidatus Roizmanbacteria bacterium RIFCSPHIGHO2_02_FULL_37_15]OGK32135.1 MAG: hypothetical protein A3F57_03635 [Candidatus Roizmanbacteria bacterium RIFCSPHIGHO2_12_FULL_36_11]OGK45669.1 MAG: hypothetical protein A3B40_04280 [Candidatus Roizmanbacteria bacterium RIFCSPLOWO2_01_FULL_37_16]OGK57859.1 MAG: hypothetical protein A3I50_02320 [C
MNNQSLLYGITGLLLGIVFTVFFASSAVNNNNTGMMQMMGMRTNIMRQQETSGNMMQGEENKGMGISMDDMMQSMEGKEGDEFDKAFMESMTIHHQGAIEMAKKAKEMAKHDEIKKMADDIISAQTSEINMMMQWQKNWGYE